MGQLINQQEIGRTEARIQELSNRIQTVLADHKKLIAEIGDVGAITTEELARLIETKRDKANQMNEELGISLTKLNMLVEEEMLRLNAILS